MPKEEDGKSKRQKLNSYDVAHWPEFKLFCERAGIILDIGWRSMIIKLEVGACLSVTQEYLPDGFASGPKTEGDES